MVKNSIYEKDFFDSLPFNLTNSQRKVWDEIKDDMLAMVPMRRLLQGDVGSGKTIVGALAALHAKSNDWQTAILCPTEILAEQHFSSFSDWFESLGIKVSLLTGSTRAKDKVPLIRELAEGNIDILIGTHAIFQQGIEFKNLGLTVIDEQHRFGEFIRDFQC